MPAATGMSHCMSGAVDSSHRSELNSVAGVLAGTVASNVAFVGYVVTLLPVLWYGLGEASLSAAQSGPPSVAGMAGPPALTR